MVKIPFLNLSVFEKTSQTQNNALRPLSDPYQVVGGEVKLAVTPLPIQTLYEVAKYSDVVKTIIQALKKIFRNGYEIQELFAKKCSNCGKDFENPTDVCDACGGMDLIEPDNNELKFLEEFCESVNYNSQSLIQFSEQVNPDFEIADDAFILAVKEYQFTQLGDYLPNYTRVCEFIRLNPIVMEIVADKGSRLGWSDNNQRVMVCANHRNTVVYDKDRCEACKCVLFPAHYRSRSSDGKFVYYAPDEVYHDSKYSRSLLYGFSNLFAGWAKISTLMNMDEYMKLYYSKQRPPRGILTIKTTNADSLKKNWDQLLAEYKVNPHTISPLMIAEPPGQQTKGDPVQFIDFMRSLDEMQFTEVREEFRRTLGALYGVMPIFQGDISSAGGLNNESQQITVTNDAIEFGQKMYNEGLYPWMLRQLNIKHYKIVLLPAEKQNEVAKEQLFAQKLANAKIMQELGFEVTLTSEDEFEYGPTEVPIKKPEPMNPFGGTGGFNPASPPSGETEQDQESQGQPITVDSSEDVGKNLVKMMVNKEYSDITKDDSFNLPASLSKSHVEAISKNILKSYPSENDEDIAKNISVIKNKVRIALYSKMDPDKKNRYSWVGDENGAKATEKGVDIKVIKKMVDDNLSGHFYKSGHSKTATYSFREDDGKLQVIKKSNNAEVSYTIKEGNGRTKVTRHKQ